MTNLAAALYDRLIAWTWGRADATANSTNDRGDFRLRALPKEDIDFYIKRIDNSRVARAVDNRDFAASVSMSGGVTLASILIILLLAPGVYNLLAARRIEKLRDEHAALENEWRRVQVMETEALNARHLKSWAEQRYVEPTAAEMIFAPPSGDAVAALEKR